MLPIRRTRVRENLWNANNSCKTAECRHYRRSVSLAQLPSYRPIRRRIPTDELIGSRRSFKGAGPRRFVKVLRAAVAILTRRPIRCSILDLENSLHVRHEFAQHIQSHHQPRLVVTISDPIAPRGVTVRIPLHRDHTSGVCTTHGREIKARLAFLVARDETPFDRVDRAPPHALTITPPVPRVVTSSMARA